MLTTLTVLAVLAFALARPGPARAAVVPLPPLGSPTAPVEIVEWGDFQCPHCAAFAHDTQPALTREYFATGLARLEWRDFANHGPESVDAAVAARAAARQGAFWPYHDYLFAHQARENSGSWTRVFFLRAAQSLGLDVPRFAADLADPSLRDVVTAESARARSQAPAGTPTFVVDGLVVAGAQPADVFRQAIAAALARARVRAGGVPSHHVTQHPATPHSVTPHSVTPHPIPSSPGTPSPGTPHPITRPEHRPGPSAAARHPRPGPSHRPSAPHGPARPTPAPDAPRASGT